MSLEIQIKARALELGFDLVGITTADPPAHLAFFQQWITDGHQATMSYLARQAKRRADPQLVLPGAKSIVVVACNYHFATPETNALQGRISRYALGDDYHAILETKLATLTTAIQKLVPGTQAKAYVDTGPIFERELAQRAGLGWIGKNSMLVSPKFGPWLFLGEILLDLPLQADPPETRTPCGDCTRCIESCPTRAIRAPRQLDARRCIAYLTIELKGPIPVELRPLIGNRVFGCDDCLEACPWNRFAQQAREAGFAAKKELTTPQLVELLSISPEEFDQRFARSPILRTKRSGLLRNVCIALGNSHDPRATAPLKNAMTDSDPLIREHAAWALEQLDRPSKNP